MCIDKQLGGEPSLWSAALKTMTITTVLRSHACDTQDCNDDVV